MPPWTVRQAFKVPNTSCRNIPDLYHPCNCWLCMAHCTQVMIIGCCKVLLAQAQRQARGVGGRLRQITMHCWTGVTSSAKTWGKSQTRSP